MNIRFSGVTPLKDPGVQAAIAAEEAKLGSRGRVLIRASGTEPVIRVMVEAEEEETLTRSMDALCDVIRAKLGT